MPQRCLVHLTAPILERVESKLANAESEGGKEFWKKMDQELARIALFRTIFADRLPAFNGTEVKER